MQADEILLVSTLATCFTFGESEEFELTICVPFCSPGCQKADWPRHKKVRNLTSPVSCPLMFLQACKVIESVNWVNWPAH